MHFVRALPSEAATFIELIPYVDDGDSRWFDHNRLTDELGSYRLDGYQGWSIPDASDVCPPTTPDGRLVLRREFVTGVGNGVVVTIYHEGRSAIGSSYVDPLDIRVE